MAKFDHQDDGTPANQWTHYKKNFKALELPDSGSYALAVLAAHPDDEVLGAGALITSFLAQGGKVEVGLATAGEGADPNADDGSKRALAKQRLQEFSAAATSLKVGSHGVSASFFDLPDSKLNTHEKLLNDTLESWYSTLSAKLAGTRIILIAPYRHDGHSDHEALGRAAEKLAKAHQLTMWEYPIWFWHWSSPANSIESKLDWHRFEATSQAFERKKCAIQANVSQLSELREGQGKILSDSFLQHFSGVEIFRISNSNQGVEYTSQDASQVFDQVYELDSDPWAYENSWYEQRKRSLTLGLLGRPTYRHILEIGCSIGYTTRELAPRCQTLTATDASAKALSHAAELLADQANVELIQGTVPLQWPKSSDPEPFDLVVLSEIGYYLSLQDLGQVDRWVRANSSPDCELLLCHWRHPIEGWESSAEAVHRYFLNSPHWTLSCALVEVDTLQQVFVKKDRDGR